MLRQQHNDCSFGNVRKSTFKYYKVNTLNNDAEDLSEKQNPHNVDILGVTYVTIGKMIKPIQVLMHLYIPCLSDVMILSDYKHLLKLN